MAPFRDIRQRKKYNIRYELEYSQKELNALRRMRRTVSCVFFLFHRKVLRFVLSTSRFPMKRTSAVQGKEKPLYCRGDSLYIWKNAAPTGQILQKAVALHVFSIMIFV